MAKVIPRDPEANTSISESISFQKDDETGYFKKISLVSEYNHVDHTVKKRKPIISEALYEAGTEEDHQYSFEVSSPSGKLVTVYFREV